MPEYYAVLKNHYEETLEKFGPSAKGMDWPSEEGLKRRFEVMLDVTNGRAEASLLDIGCGVGLLLSHIKEHGLQQVVTYHGSDVSEKMVSVARENLPDGSFETRDILLDPYPNNSFDFVVMNGVLTEKQTMSQTQMCQFAVDMISAAFQACRIGCAFNVMSTHVDWRRSDLFHWDLDQVVAFLVAECSRNIRIRMDYGMYEYTVYVYK